MRGSHTQIHMTLDHVVTRCHVANQNCLSPVQKTRPITSELDRVVTKDHGLSPLKSYEMYFA